MRRAHRRARPMPSRNEARGHTPSREIGRDQKRVDRWRANARRTGGQEPSASDSRGRCRRVTNVERGMPQTAARAGSDGLGPVSASAEEQGLRCRRVPRRRPLARAAERPVPPGSPARFALPSVRRAGRPCSDERARRLASAASARRTMGNSRSVRKVAEARRGRTSPQLRAPRRARCGYAPANRLPSEASTTASHDHAVRVEHRSVRERELGAEGRHSRSPFVFGGGGSGTTSRLAGRS